MANFPNVASFVQSVRLRARLLKSNEVLLVVEGATDKRALSPYLDLGVSVIPASGKSFLLGAYRDLEYPLRTQVLFILDCDGETDSDLKGRNELILTVNRDLEADLLYELNALERVTHELLAPRYDKPSGISKYVADITRHASEMAGAVGAARQLATQLGLRTRVEDEKTRKKRRLSLKDLPEAKVWCLSSNRPTTESAINAIADLHSWDPAERSIAISLHRQSSTRSCTSHHQGGCNSCGRRHLCNGHDLVDALHLIFTEQYKVSLGAGELDRHIRIAADRNLLSSWGVPNRLRRWENVSGLRVLA